MSVSADPRDNPFFVLELPTNASDIEVERAGRKLLGLLPLGAAKARAYDTPLGPASRDESKVREAMSALHDPGRRVVAEIVADAMRVALPDVGARFGTWPQADALRVLRKR